MKILKVEIDYSYEIVRVYYQLQFRDNDQYNNRFGFKVISFLMWNESNVFDENKIIELINKP